MKKLKSIFNAKNVADVNIEMNELYIYNVDLFWKLMREVTEKQGQEILDYILPPR